MKAIILDGYVDEPACFGVPPYLSPYPRYVAGALINCGFSKEEISYYTIDTVRALGKSLTAQFKEADVFIIISGMTVPGKYLRNTPITADEIRALFKLSTGIKMLGGPIRLGYSNEGGVAATNLSFLPDDVLVAQKDIESFVYDYFSNSTSDFSSNPDSDSKSNSSSDFKLLTHRYRTTAEIAEWSKTGAFIAAKHPDFPNLICELETYRGCGRKKHCSFCTEAFYGRPDFREEDDIIAETKTLYELGVRHFRIGRQPDLFAYKGIDDGGPILKPNPAAIEKLYSGIRNAAPDLKTLHMDNGNPITLAEFPNESREILETIVKYHTPGDIIAMGIESADPAVISANGLKATSEQVLQAIRLVNEIGSCRGSNGMPEILPGINFVYGLADETKKTYRLNYDFLKQIYDEGLMVRRINLRQVMVFQKTPLFDCKISDFKNEKLFRAHKETVRKTIDFPMLQRVVPIGTVLKDVFTEIYETGNEKNAPSKTITFGRQFGTYPLLIGIPEKLELNRFYDILITKHGFRSVTGIPFPVSINSAAFPVLKELPGLNKAMTEDLIQMRPFKDEADFLNRFKNGKLIAKYVCYDSSFGN